MLDYSLPPTPGTDDQPAQRWFIKKSNYDSARRSLHLQQKRRYWFGWRTLRHNGISVFDTTRYGFEHATRKAAEEIIKDFTVNRFLPTGEVK